MTKIYQKGLTSTSGGNLSIMDAQGNMWITPGSIDKARLTAQDIICVFPDGSFVGKHRPSIEYKFHQKIYQLRPELKAVVHAHPTGLVGYSLVQRLPDVKLFFSAEENIGKLLLAQYALPGSDKLVNSVAEAFSEGCDAAVMANHGAITASALSLADAYNRFECLESLGRIESHTCQFGNPLQLTKEEIDRFSTYSPECVSETHSRVARFDLQERQELLYWIQRAAHQRLISGAMFSFSCRAEKTVFLINPKRMGAGEMDENDLVSIEGDAAEYGKTPDRLWSIHRAIYEAHPEINAVLINYSEAMMGLACSDAVLETRSMPETYIMLRSLPCLSMQEYLDQPDRLPGMLGEATPVMYVKNGFVISTGGCLQTAFDRMEVAEYAAGAAELARRFGSVKSLPEEEIKMIQEAFHLT